MLLSMFRRVIGFLSFCLFIGLSFGCQRHADLPQNGQRSSVWTPGFVFHRLISLESDFQIPIAGVQADFQKSRMLLRCEVLSVDPEQSATLKVTIEKLTASLKSLGIFCQYDSSVHSSPQTGQNLPDANSKQKKLQAQYEKTFEGLAGSAFLAHLDIKNNQIRLDIQDPKLNQLSQRQPAGMIGPDQLSLLLSRNSLCEYIDPGILQNHPDPLKADSTWDSILWLETPKAAAIPVLKTCTMESITSHSGNSIANIHFTLTSPILESEKQSVSKMVRDAPPGPAKPAFQILTLTGEGQAQIDFSRGILLRSVRQYQAYIRVVNSKSRSSISAEIPEKSNTSYRIRQTIDHLP